MKERISHLIHNPVIGGAILFLSAVIAFAWANLNPDSYHIFWHQTPIHIGDFRGDFSVQINTWHHFVNEFLMAVFFFYVGLEIRREFVSGQLENPKKAILPIAAAIGGMVVPATIYAIFNSGTDSAHGWGIPMATDIAFSLGVLALLGSRAPLSLKVFLTALAIVDDLGAVLVIAIFYTREIMYESLFIGLGTLVFLFVLNKVFKIRNLQIFHILGILLVWIPFLESGVHSTIAGVLLAMVVPGKVKISNVDFRKKLDSMIKKLDVINTDHRKGNLEKEAVDYYIKIKEITKSANNPAQTLEKYLHPIVTFVIMPLFALGNAGVHLEGNILSLLTDKITIGVGLGLILGKLIGVYGITAIFYKLGVGKLPDGVELSKIIGIGLLAGMGFTMSLFVTELAFEDNHMKSVAKVGVLISSLLAGIIGYLQLHFALNKNK